MIDSLKFLLDECDNNPKLKSLLLKVASLPEEIQDEALDLMRIIIEGKN